MENEEYKIDKNLEIFHLILNYNNGDKIEPIKEFIQKDNFNINIKYYRYHYYEYIDQGWQDRISISDGETPLHYIAQTAKFNLIELFIQYGADINALDPGGCSPLFNACFPYINDYPCNNSKENCTNFFTFFNDKYSQEWIHRKYIKTIKILLNNNADYLLKINRCQTVLDISELTYYDRRVKYVLNKKTDNINDYPVLTYKYFKKNINIQSKGSIRYYINSFNTYELKEGHLNISGKIISVTSGHYGLSWSYSEKAEYASRAILTIAEINSDKSLTGTKYRIHHDDIKKIDTFYSSEKNIINISEKNNVDNNSLEIFYLIDKYDGCNDPIKELIQQDNFNINIKYYNDDYIKEGRKGLLFANEGQTPLHYIAERAEIKLIKLFVQYGADINALDDYGCTPLFYACFTDNIHSYPYDPIKENNFPFYNFHNDEDCHEWVYNHYIETILEFLNYEVNFLIKTNGGQTVFDIAELTYYDRRVKYALHKKSDDLNAYLILLPKNLKQRVYLKSKGSIRYYVQCRHTYEYELKEGHLNISGEIISVTSGLSWSYSEKAEYASRAILTIAEINSDENFTGKKYRIHHDDIEKMEIVKKLPTEDLNIEEIHVELNYSEPRIIEQDGQFILDNQINQNISGLNENIVSNAPYKQGRTYSLSDGLTGNSSLLLSIYSKEKLWVVQYKQENQRKKSIVIGKSPSMSLINARKRYQELKVNIDKNRDPIKFEKEEDFKNKNRCFLDPSVLPDIQNSILFYPCSGNDFSVPVDLFGSVLSQLWFIDRGYFSPNHQDTRFYGLDAIAEEQTPLLQNNENYTLTETKITEDLDWKPSKFIRRRRQQRMQPCLLSETYRHHETNQSVQINRYRHFGLPAFNKHIGSIGVFFYRGDSMGEGGSGDLWLKGQYLENILDKLIDGGLFVTDGSNGSSYPGLSQYYGTSYERLPDPERVVKSCRPFTDEKGRTFTCVGYAGMKYGPTLIWQVRKRVA